MAMKTSIKAALSQQKQTIGQREKDEIIKCAKQPHYFIAKYCKIQHPKYGLIPFSLWPFQKEIINDYLKERFILCVKSRQIGISTLTANYALWLALFHPDQSILFFATKLEIAKNLKDKVVIAYDNLPDWLKVSKISTSNTTLFKLKNRSWIKCVATSKKAIRSEALSLLVFDEAAFIDNMETIWAGASPAVSHGGKVFALSSPNGEGNWFHSQVEESKAGAGAFLIREIMWDLVPERNAAWEKEERKRIGDEMFAQEYECSFLASGRTVIGPAILKEMAKTIEQPKELLYIDACRHVWEKYDESQEYFMTADVARGDATDFSVLNVFRVGEKLEQVCEYKGKLPLEEFPKLIYETGLEYGGCLVCAENNVYGSYVLLKLKEFKYPRIYYGKKEWDHEEIYDINRSYEFDAGRNAGIYTTGTNRPLFVQKLEDDLRNGKIIVRSLRALNELRTFIWQNGKPQAAKNKNDDIVMTLCFASWIYSSVFRGGAISSSGSLLDLTKLISKSSTNHKNSLEDFIKRHGRDSREVQTPAMAKKYKWLFS